MAYQPPSSENGQQILAGLMFVCFAIETYAEYKAGNFPPRPVRFVGVGAVYGTLMLFSHASSTLAVLLGIGMLIALIVKIPTLGSAGATSPQATGGGTTGNNPAQQLQGSPNGSAQGATTRPFTQAK